MNPIRLLHLLLNLRSSFLSKGALTLATSQLRHYSLLRVVDFLPDKLVPKCRSCGIKLQSISKDKPGFYIKQRQALKATTKNALDDVYTSVIQNLDQEERSLLKEGSQQLQALAITRQATNFTPSRSDNLKSESTELECLRCRHVKFHLKFDNAELSIEPPTKVMESIPPWAKIVYVVSAQDFPMSLDSKVFQFWPARDMLFVVTKGDLLFRNNKTAQEKGLRFFQDYLQRTYDVTPEQVFMVSGQVNWGISKLLSSLHDDSFFIGSVNSGKSTLIQSLLYVQSLLRDKLKNQKKADSRDSSVLRRRRIRDLQEFKERNGPGASYMPGFTRSILPIELCSQKTVFDVPGFGGGESDSLYKIITPAAMKQLQKGVNFHKLGVYTSHYDTIKEGQTATIGGLFFLTVPPQSMYRMRNMINHTIYVFKDHEKAISSWKNSANLPALRDVFLVDSELTELVRYEIPPFVGSVDLVFKNLGFITITATGGMPDDKVPMVVYLPNEVSVCARVPISKYITKTLSGRDRKGDPLPKKDWVRYSTKEMKRYVGREPLTQSLKQLGPSLLSDHS